MSEVPAVQATDMIGTPKGEASKDVAERVIRARKVQQSRFEEMNISCRTNGQASASVAEMISQPDSAGEALLRKAAESMRFSARAYHRILKVARTIADLEGQSIVGRIHLAEAIAYRSAGTSMASTI